LNFWRTLPEKIPQRSEEEVSEMIADRCYQMNTRPPEHSDTTDDMFEPSYFTGICKRRDSEVDFPFGLELQICEEEFLGAPSSWPFSE